jgi:flagellar protein FliO/FliZ
MTASSGLSSLLWFLAILAMIPLALWLLKRTPVGGGAAHGVMRNVAVLPLSPSQRIVTVEVGQGDARRWLVLGVTPQSISTLHTLVPQDEALLSAPPSATVPPLPSFAQMLGRLRQGARREN